MCLKEIDLKVLFLGLLSLFMAACNSGGSSSTADYGESYVLLGKSVPDYGNCKNEKLCVTNINPKTQNYGNNTLLYIPVGQFGLVGYTLKNQTKSDISPVEVSKGAFPDKQFTEDIYRSSCIDNVLSPQEECNIVLKYYPLYYSVYGDIKFRFEADKLNTQYIIETYSSRGK